jgi:hypothetical protein
MKIIRTTIIAALSSYLALASAGASTISEAFVFFDTANSVVASGSFSFDSSETGTIGYSDLSSFSISVFGTTYDRTYVSGLAPAPTSFIYFGYDLSANEFVPASIPGYTALPFSGVLAATDGVTGFFFSPLAGSADPAGTGADGSFAEYSSNQAGVAASLVIQPVPEPSTWVMFALGFLPLGFCTIGAQGQLLRPKSKPETGNFLHDLFQLTY